MKINTYHTHLGCIQFKLSAPGVKQYTCRKSATTIKVYIYICAFSCLICHIIYIYIRELVDSLCRDGADVQYMQYLSKSRIYIYLQTSVSAYDIQFHHCHQCSVESCHNGRKSGYTDHCCIGMLHFDRKLHKFVREMSTAVRLQKLENS